MMLASTSFTSYVSENSDILVSAFLRHTFISLYGVLFAAILTIPLGFYLARHGHIAKAVLRVAGIIQTVPSLAMLSLLMIGLGLGTQTVVATVFLYSILPILQNTYVGVRSIDAGLIDTAKGMGMSPRQITFKVELPLAMSVIMGGLRNAIVLAVGITAIGTFIGAGGLGDIISRGINVADGGAIIFAGALPCALMAIFADLGLAFLERRLDPSSRAERRRHRKKKATS